MGSWELESIPNLDIVTRLRPGPNNRSHHCQARSCQPSKRRRSLARWPANDCARMAQSVCMYSGRGDWRGALQRHLLLISHSQLVHLVGNKIGGGMLYNVGTPHRASNIGLVECSIHICPHKFKPTQGFCVVFTLPEQVLCQHLRA